MSNQGGGKKEMTPQNLAYSAVSVAGVCLVFVQEAKNKAITR